VRPLFVFSLVALFAAGCGKDNSSPTSPTTTTKTDTFNGTVAVGGRDIHTFTVDQAGTVSVTLTAASPPASVVMGVGIGIPADGVCGVLPGGSVMAVAGSTAQLTGVVSPGMLCVAVYDVGNQTATVTYTVTVNHT
jgi:hypothetical protein